LSSVDSIIVIRLTLVQVLTIISMLSESGHLFYRPKAKKLHADQAHRNFVRVGGDHFTLLNVWDQWVDANYSQQFCYEHFLQFRSLSRVREIRDQLAGLCERVEIVIERNPNASDTSPFQKAILAGYFYNTVSSLSLFSSHGRLTVPCFAGTTAEEWRFVSHTEDQPYCVYTSLIELVPASTTGKGHLLLRTCHDVEVVYAVCYPTSPALSHSAECIQLQ
jgi:hypothetical protein